MGGAGDFGDTKVFSGPLGRRYTPSARKWREGGGRAGRKQNRKTRIRVRE
jgi:hypothetical protein